MTAGNRRSKALRFLVVLVCLLGCKHRSDDEILRIAPKIPPDFARHLALDHDTALRRFAREAGVLTVRRTFGLLWVAPLGAAPEQFAAVESIATPRLELLASILGQEFKDPNVPLRYRAYREFPVVDRKRILELMVQIGETAADSTLPIGEKARAYARLIKDTEPYAAVVARSDLYGSYCELLPRTDPAALEPNLRSGIAEAESHRDYIIACQMLGMLGIHYWQMEKIDAMRNCWDRALVYARGIESWHEPRILSFYSRYYWSTGQLAMSRDLLLQAMDRCHEHGYDFAEIRYVYEWLNFLTRLQCWDVLDTQLQRADFLLRRVGNPFWQTQIQRIELARAAAANDGARVSVMVPRLKAAIQTFLPHPAREHAQLDIADALLDCERAREARVEFESGRLSCLQNKIPELLAPCDLGIARADLELGDTAGCEACLARYRSTPTAQRKDALESWLIHDVVSVQSSIRAGCLPEAERRLETALRRIREVDREFDVGSETSLMIAQSRPLLDAAHLLGPHTPEDGYALEMLWRQLQVHSHAMLDTRSQRGQSLLGQAAEASRKLRAELESIDAIHCVYDVSGDRVRRWTAMGGVVVCDTLQVESLELAHWVQSINKHLADPDALTLACNSDFLRASYALSELLLPPIILESPTPVRFLVSADGCLLQLPFEALSLAPDRFEPLGCRHRLASLRSWEPHRRATTGPPIAVLAPEYPQDTRSRYPILDEELLHAPAEVATLQRSFPGTRTLEGWSATKPVLVSSWVNAPLLYFATHVIQDPQLPYLAFIPLGALGGPELPVQDSNIEIMDIRRADLRGCQLVVLSGCSTGASYVSNVVAGPSLGEAFLDAGAHAVVHTYWSVEDEAAATFMTMFIRRYARTEDPIDAMMLARREALEKWIDPRQWLAYSVMVNSIASPSVPRSLAVTTSASVDSTGWIPD